MIAEQANHLAVAQRCVNNSAHRKVWSATDPMPSGLQMGTLAKVQLCPSRVQRGGGGQMQTNLWTGRGSEGKGEPSHQSDSMATWIPGVPQELSHSRVFCSEKEVKGAAQRPQNEGHGFYEGNEPRCMFQNCPWRYTPQMCGPSGLQRFPQAGSMLCGPMWGARPSVTLNLTTLLL